MRNSVSPPQFKIQHSKFNIQNFYKCETLFRHHNFGAAETSLVCNTNITVQTTSLVRSTNIIQRSLTAAVPHYQGCQSICTRVHK